MGCSGSKEGQPAGKNDNPLIDDIDIPDIDPRYPPPNPPKSNKNDFYRQSDYDKIDAQVKQQIARINASTYDDLAAALGTICSTDLEKLRAIFVWLFLQNIHGSFYSGVTDPYTPRGYMKLIKTANGSYATFFAQLCRAAGIRCNVLRGVGRGDPYVVGQSDVSDLETAWCAVHVSGEWRLVHPLWSYFKEKQIYTDGRRPDPGTKRVSINEFFYLIDPNKMITFCFPDAAPWQLLKSKWDTSKFVKSPMFTEEYFTSGLMLPRKFNAIIPADNGICLVDFDHQSHVEPTVEPKVQQQAEQDEREKEREKERGGASNQGQTPKAGVSNQGQTSKVGAPNQGQTAKADARMSNYVITASSSTRKTIVVKFPSKGKYSLEVYGGTDASKPKIVEFRLECGDVTKSPQPFPLLPLEGFGLLPGPASTLGVSDMSPDSGIVLVKPTQEKIFSFTTAQPLELKADLVHNTASSLEDFVSCQEAEHQGQVKVVVPEENVLEFGLQISARPSKTTRAFTLIASFLLVDEKWRKKTAIVSPRRGGANADAVRKALIAAGQGSDILRLEKAVGDFQRQGLPDNGDLTRARHKLVELHLENLRNRTQERKLEPLDDAIEAARRSQVATELIYSMEMQEAEAVRRQLRRLKLYMHKVLALNKATISEIHRYHRPKPLVHNVMKATFRVLGEPQKKIQDWSYIQTCMRQLGRNSMMARVRQFDPVSMRPVQVKDAQGYLDQTNKYLVRMCSAGAGTFYVWSNNMISEQQGKGQIDPLEIWQSKPGISNNDSRNNNNHNDDRNSTWSKLSPRGKGTVSSRALGERASPYGKGGSQVASNAASPRRDVYGENTMVGPTEEEDEEDDQWEPNRARPNDHRDEDVWSTDEWDPNPTRTGRKNGRYG